MSETEVCLKWNTFHECIMSSFGLLWQEDQLTDVTITAGDNAIHAHKVILSACSPFFKKIFQETSCRHPTIILPGADIIDLKKILAFIYKGEVFIEQERLSPFLRLAEELQIRGLWKPNEIQEIDGPTRREKDREQPANRIRKNDGEPPSKRTKRKNNSGYSSSSFQAETSRPIRLEEIKQEDIVENNFRLSVDSPFENYALLTSKWMRNEDPNDLDHLQVTNRDMEHFPYLRLPYSDLLPSTEHLQVWARNRSLDQFACDLMKLLFTKDERIVCNVNGKMGKLQFNPHKINLIKEVLQFYSRIPESAFEEQWKVCVTKIDTANRGLKRRFKCKDIFNFDRSSSLL